METKKAIEWVTDEHFRENAKRFYQNSKKIMRMPYSEVIFVEIVCAIFTVIKKEQKAKIILIEDIATKAIKQIWTEKVEYAIRELVRAFMEGEKIGDAPDGRWFDFCCKYRYRIMRRYSIRNEYCRRIAEKEREIIDNHEYSHIQNDLIHLAVTIELL